MQFTTQKADSPDQGHQKLNAPDTIQVSQQAIFSNNISFNRHNYIQNSVQIFRANLMMDRQRPMLKRCVQKIYDATNFKHGHTPEERHLVGDLGSNVERTHRVKPSEPRKRKKAIFRDLVVNLVSLLKQQQRESKLIYHVKTLLSATIEPTSYFMYSWNFISLLVIFHNIFIIPLVDSFPGQFKEGECEIFRGVIYCELVILDMFVQFNVKLVRKGEILESKKEIFLEYLKSGLIFDVLALFGFLVNRFDFLRTNSCAHDTTQYFAMIAKYLYMLKFKQLSQLIAFFHLQFSYSNKIKNYLLLIKLLSLIFILAHLFACLWIMIGTQSRLVYGTNTWIGQLSTNTESKLEIYLKSMYFACMTMTTVGYGDIVPVNNIEYLCCIVMMILSSAIFAYSLNTITYILKDLQSQTEIYDKEVNQITNYMRKREIDATLQARIKNYLKSIQDAGLNDNVEEHTRIVNKLSVSLRNELLMQDRGIMFKDSIIESNFSEQFQHRLAGQVQELRYSPGEIIKPANQPYDGLIYMVRGELEFGFESHQRNTTQSTKLFSLHSSQRYGWQELFNLHPNVQKHTITSKDFSVIYLLRNVDLEQLVYSAEFANSHDRIRYCSLKDRLRFNGDLKVLELKCQLCGQLGHEFGRCKRFFFLTNKPVVLARHNFATDHPRHIFKRISNVRGRYLGKVRTLADKFEIQMKLEDARNNLSGFTKNYGYELDRAESQPKGRYISLNDIDEEVSQKVSQEKSDISGKSWRDEIEENFISPRPEQYTLNSEVRLNSQDHPYKSMLSSRLKKKNTANSRVLFRENNQNSLFGSGSNEQQDSIPRINGTMVVSENEQRSNIRQLIMEQLAKMNPTSKFQQVEEKDETGTFEMHKEFVDYYQEYNIRNVLRVVNKKSRQQWLKKEISKKSARSKGHGTSTLIVHRKQFNSVKSSQ